MDLAQITIYSYYYYLNKTDQLVDAARTYTFVVLISFINFLQYLKFYLPMSFHIRMIIGVTTSSNFLKFMLVAAIATVSFSLSYVLMDVKEEAYWVSELGYKTELLD
jgi:hypothetical protein